MKWIVNNFKTIVYIFFIVPILTVAFVSISHVTTWYGLTNPISWAVYLSVGIEIAALSALAAISAKMGSKVYFPFGIVTLIQFIGNIFFAYQYIDTNGQSFKDWVDLVDPLVTYLGIESGDVVGHKRFLALFSGGMLPIISLSFLHMLVKFEEENKYQISSINENVRGIEMQGDNIESPKIDNSEIQENDVESPKIDNSENIFTEKDDLIEEYRTFNESKFNFLNETPDIQVQLENTLELEDKVPDSKDGIRRLSYVKRDV
jgi:hypothetical protein